MSNNNNHPLGEAPWGHVIFSTGLGSGFFPWGPGTMGALMALVIWYLIYWWLGAGLALTLVTIALIVITTILGAWTSEVMERYWGEDPRTVNIDEYVGTWIPLLIAPMGDNMWMTAITAFLGFALFRVIDIFKLFGCRKVEEKIHGGWGVMLDDVAAGAYALLILWLLKLLIFTPWATSLPTA
ncbi:MAG: phosphatidylglycerophosphatase A [Muribaculaceae bacterium]|nr:phosphatidylglycerophosphatase A [Muribaculaceae bacterium]